MTILGVQIPLVLMQMILTFISAVILLIVISLLFEGINISFGKWVFNLFSKRKFPDTMQYIECVLDEVKVRLKDTFETLYRELSASNDVDHHNREIRIFDTMISLFWYRIHDRIKEVIQNDDKKITIEMRVQNIKAFQSTWLSDNWLNYSVKWEDFNNEMNNDKNTKEFLIKAFANIFKKSRNLPTED
ncbi:MAG: hypothetical protein WC389_03665 [Lutibacter sp.]|jgi:hypothetical protein